MKKICKFLLGLSLLLTLILACSTLPTESDDLETSQGKGSINFALSGVSSTNSNILFSTATNSEDTPQRVSISYRKSGATSEATTSMELSAFGSSFVLADPISLEAGDYEVTKFDVLSSSGKTIYSTPMTGSLVDSFLKVKTSLIYSFTIISSKASTIDMQVVEVNKDSDPADFGRDAFTYEVISYNQFYIKTSLINEKSELTPTTATLTIKNPSGDIITNANLSADKNKILVPNYDIYTIIVSKEGLLPKTYSFSKADLTKYKKEALEVHLFSTTHVYKLINKSLSWQAAKTYCENMGGYLVSITNVDEKEYILNKIMIPNNVPCCWGGASDFRSEGTWSWENKKENWIYSNWASGEPNNYLGNEDYLLINRDGTWNDYGDGHTIFICEWNSEAEVKEYSEHVYKLYEKSLSWSEAKAYCENLGGYLVSITSQEEQKYVYDNILVPNNVPCCWAGGSDSETEGVWKWASGEEWIYNNWRAGEPNNYGGKEDYLLLYGTGVWNDYADGNTIFICEWNSEADMKTTTTADYTNSIGMEFVLVEAGTFMMGDSAVKYGYGSITVHEVTLTKDYYIGKYEVTQAQWVAVMGSNPSSWKGDNLPVENVSWNMIQEFISKLNQMEGTDKYRLPTEAEWEFAARGGNKSKGYTYAGSNNVDEVAWYTGYSTYQVGTKKANELGIYDMSGNVFEWCFDWWGYYSSESQTDPSGPSTGLYRVLRSCFGSFGTEICHVAYRYIGNPSNNNNCFGFRLARSK